MDTLLYDVRYAIRSLRKSASFTVIAILTLALGIGGNSALFALLDATMLRPLPRITAPERLVWLAGLRRDVGRTTLLSYAELRDLRDLRSSFSGIAAYEPLPFNLGGGTPERIAGQMVSGDYFAVLGVTPALGRSFLPEEDAVPGRNPVAVLSDDLWRRRFAADPSAIGTTVVLNGHVFTIIGVAPPRFIGPELDDRVPDVWLPIMMFQQAAPNEPDLLESRAARELRVIARLAPGVDRARADGAVSALASRLAAAYPGDYQTLGLSVSGLTGGVHPHNVGEVLPLAILGFGVTGIVLLIACANVANLLLGRAAGRRREIGIRLALGASRARLLRQLMTESMVLTLAAAVVGLGASVWTSDAALARIGLPIPLDLSPDWRVLAVTIAVAIATGVLFGLVPALDATRPELVPTLKDGGVGTPGGARGSRLQAVFVVTQVALSIVLLASAALLLRSLSKANKVDPGFEPRRVLAISFDLGTQGYSPERRQLFYSTLLARTLAIPGARAASLTSLVPMGGTMWGNEVYLEGDTERGRRPTVTFDNVRPGYFATIGTPLVTGRDLTLRDRKGAPGVVVVNEEMARRSWPGESPLGKRISMEGPAGPFMTVVGVARDGKYDELGERPRPYLYLPEMQQSGYRSQMTLLVRSDGDPAALAAPVSRLVRSLDPTLPVYAVQTLGQVLRERQQQKKAGSELMSAFGLLALGLASLGVYGVMAHSVARRTREIGVRMALGARERDVLRLFVGGGLRLTAIGTAIGLLLAIAAARALRSTLVGLSAVDGVTFAGVALVIAAAGLLATWLPARRATRVDPVITLRAE
ncbi:MAG: ABC transporter permease [Gemmatimonadota bacterium]|nr:ABC transporter permease [Gemmatimonadota bacterium]